jgi:hypothetical protein
MTEMTRIKQGYWKIGNGQQTYLAYVSQGKTNDKFDYEALKFESGKMEVRNTMVGPTAFWPCDVTRISEKEYFLTKLRGRLTAEQEKGRA